MKLYLFLLTALISSSAFADNFTSATAGNVDAVPENTVEVKNYDPVLDDGVRPYAVEVGFQSLGDFGSQPYRTFSGSSTRASQYYQATDGLFSITGRKYFSSSFDLSFTGTVLNSVSSPANPTTPDNSIIQVSMRPFSIGGRYHRNYFGDAIMAFGQLDLGEALISETLQLPYGNGDTNHYFRAFAKLTTGADFFLSPKTPVYFGLKLGYVAMSEFGGFTTGIDVGYAF